MTKSFPYNLLYYADLACMVQNWWIELLNIDRRLAIVHFGNIVCEGLEALLGKVSYLLTHPSHRPSKSSGWRNNVVSRPAQQLRHRKHERVIVGNVLRFNCLEGNDQFASGHDWVASARRFRTMSTLASYMNVPE